MKTLNFVLIVCTFTLLSCQNAQKPEISDLVPKCERFNDGVFIHVSKGYNNPQKVLMALSLVLKMTETQDVALFFDIEGVKLLTKTSEDIQIENYMTLYNALDKLIENNIIIMACPMCLKNANIELEQLKDGIISVIFSK